MSDDMPLKLPRYVFRRANGSFRYKRNVPLHLRAMIGKATLYRQLGDSCKEATQNLPLVHARIEALLEGEKEKSAQAKATFRDCREVYSGRLRQEVITLETVLKDYVAYKSDTPKAEKEITQRVERLRKDMQHIYGKQKLRYVSLSDISRQDANDLRDHLLSRVSANSAVRMLGVVRTAINHAIVEHSLNIPNVFTNLRIKGAGASKLDRLPLSDTQVGKLEVAYSNDRTAWALFVCLRDTGCRVSEIAGLRVKDCDTDKECLSISPTPWRTLKTNNSQRSVPLSPEAIKALEEVSQDNDPGALSFLNTQRSVEEITAQLC